MRGRPTGSPCAAGPCAAGPCAAGPCAAGPCAAGPCAAGPCAAGPWAAGPWAAASGLATAAFAAEACFGTASFVGATTLARGAGEVDVTEWAGVTVAAWVSDFRATGASAGFFSFESFECGIRKRKSRPSSGWRTSCPLSGSIEGPSREPTE
ncbi:MAG: hypothetical protein EXS36_00080 [Pedosphaera sp.]|nr:hypothetical protein [Pedosphaera sp.]